MSVASDAQREEMLHRIGCAIPTVTPDVLRDIVLAAVPSSHSYRGAVAALTANPRVLHDGVGTTTALLRVSAALAIVGAPEMYRASCAGCGGTKWLRYKRGADRLCNRCFELASAEPCCRCGRIKPVCTRDESGPICSTCYAGDTRRLERCTDCGGLARVAMRADQGPLCQLCYPRKGRACAVCGELRPVHSRRTGVDLCKDCYEDSRGRTRKRPVKVIRLRHARKRVCSSCGLFRNCIDYTTQHPRCVGCVGSPLQVCTGCGRSRKAQAIWSTGPVCSACYNRYTRHPRSCTTCSAVDLLVPGPDGDRCRHCRGDEPRANCSACDRAVVLFREGVCAQCVLAQRCATLLAQADPQRTALLQPVVDLIAATPDPLTALRWLSFGKGALIFAQLARGEIEVSHAALDALHEQHVADGKVIIYIRALLVHAGTLAPLTVASDRLGRWIDRFVSRSVPEHRPILRMFAQWYLLRRLRRKVDAGTLTEGGMKYAQARLRASSAFLSWLDERGTLLRDCSQAEVEIWLQPPRTSTAYYVKDFVRWTSRRHFSRQLNVPERRIRVRTRPSRDEDRWAQVALLLHDQDRDAATRAAGLLLLVFGQQLSRICSLRCSQLTEGADGAVRVVLGREALEMPPGVASVLLAQRDTALKNPKARRPDGDRWLFPGAFYGQHAGPHSLSRRLTEIGVHARAERTSALLFLAAELEPVVLARLLDLHTTTAVLWCRLAGRTYNRHIARRHELSHGFDP